MTDTDMPWSAPSAPPSDSSSGSDSSSSSTLTSSKAQLSGAAPAAGQPTSDLPPTAFDLLCRELDEREKAAAQQPEQGAAPGVPAWLLEPKPMEPNGGHPHQPHAEEMIAKINQDYAERDRESKQRQQEEEGALKGARLGEQYARWGQADAADKAAGAALLAAAARADAATRSGAGEHHRDEQRGWAEYDRAETAGERQQETEERRRSSGMSL